MTVKLQTNIFPIKNFDNLTSFYKLYQITGLNKEQEDYYKNCQLIIDRLSRKLRTPALVIERQNKPYLVVRDDSLEPPSPYVLIRTPVRFEYIHKIRLDYASRSPENTAICLRFLQFLIQTPLYEDRRLWLPRSGGPFFEKKPIITEGKISVFRGFKVRSTAIPNGGLGLCIDVSTKYISSYPLPIELDRDSFEEFKGKHCIYHYGHRWYDIKLAYFSDEKANERLIPKGQRLVKLIDYIIEESDKPIPPELANLKYDAPVIIYKNTRGGDCAAPAPLCYPVVDTYNLSLQHTDLKSTIEPEERERNIYHYVKKYIDALSFGDVSINVSTKPMKIRRTVFWLPDYEFGNSKIITVQSPLKPQGVKLQDIGKVRMSTLLNNEIGFYSQDPLPSHYFFMPQTVYESCGKTFHKNLCDTVDTMYPQQIRFSSDIIPYDDKKKKTYAEQGKAILQALEHQEILGGYCTVMIHHTTDHALREEDQLAAMVLREFRQRDLIASIIHTRTPRECYQHIRDADGTPKYRVHDSKRGKLQGYLRNVVLNKILLPNHRWPFVLAEPLQADITIGIDVKQHTAGITLVDKRGADIQWLCKTSRQKERLLKNQVASYIYEILKDCVCSRNTAISNIVVHRDGRTWDSEIEGLLLAVDKLKQDAILPGNAKLTILEISKSSLVPLRLFELVIENGEFNIRNPQIGSYYVADENEAYLCTTGRPFVRPGTVDPLHVIRRKGPMVIEDCLKDIFFLASLTWTKPDDCSRYPITIRLTDRFLTDVARDYDIAQLDYFIEENKEAYA